MLLGLLIAVHVIACLFIIIVVLLQSGQSADIAGAFGGLGSQTAFGPRGGATVLSRATTVAFILFVCTSVAIGIFGSRHGASSNSVLGSDKAAQTAPAQNSNPPQPAPAQQPAPQPR
jgi:preprotein translocase subunit SecG